MSTQLSLYGTEDDLNSVWANLLEWVFTDRILTVCVI